MAFLATLGADVFEWLMTKGFSVLQLDYQKWKADRAALAAAVLAQKNLENAKDGDSTDKATDSSLNNL